MTELAIIILAAGKGTRMKSSTPKVLHHVAGKPVIWHVLQTAKALSPTKTIMVLSPDSKEIEEHAAGVEIAIQKEQLGTGDAVKSALPFLQDFTGNVLILYGDCPLVTPESLKRFASSHKSGNISMIGFFASNPTGYGRLVTRRNLVAEIVEHKDANDFQRRIRLCNSGIYILEKSMLSTLLENLQNHNAQGEFYLTDIIKNATAQKIKTFYQTVPEDEVLGVNTKLDLAEVENVMQNRLRDIALLNGVTMVAPETVFLAMDTKFGENVTILPNVVIGENVEIGDNVKVGPFAHLRAGTILKNNSRIGNFVEVKKSTIGENSKASHLSYIGDAILGDNVNVGAGTITCNYDGYAKHDTVIEDDVFIGSNTAIIAPVKVKKGSIVGAGSTITADVDANSIALARAEQKNLPEGATKFRKKKKK